MKYLLQPTDNDVLHYAKGSESKSHKYISRVLNKGKWVYIYAKNRLRGNSVTNKTKGTTPYSPTANNRTNTITNTTKGVTQYNPTIKTIDTSRDIGGETINFKGHNVTKALTENMTAETKASGLTYFINLMHRGSKEVITNASSNSLSSRTGVNEQYSPTYKTSPKPYSPTIKTETWDSHKWKSGDITEFNEAREYNAKLGKTTPLKNAHRSYKDINRHTDEYDEALKQHKSRKKK